MIIIEEKTNFRNLNNIVKLFMSEEAQKATGKKFLSIFHEYNVFIKKEEIRGKDLKEELEIRDRELYRKFKKFINRYYKEVEKQIEENNLIEKQIISTLKIRDNGKSFPLPLGNEKEAKRAYKIVMKRYNNLFFRDYSGYWSLVNIDWRGNVELVLFETHDCEWWYYYYRKFCFLNLKKTH